MIESGLFFCQSMSSGWTSLNPFERVTFSPSPKKVTKRRIARKNMEKVIGHQENLDLLDLHLHDILKERYPKQVPASWVGYSRSKNSYFLRWFVVVAMSWIMSDWGFGPAII